MNAEQRKNSILQRAIEGKLVEQREEEGTAAMMDLKFAYSSNGDAFQEYDFLTGQE